MRSWKNARTKNIIKSIKMKKSWIAFAVVAMLSFTACNNDKENKEAGNGDEKVTGSKVDSLMAEVMDGHNVGMAKMDRLATMEMAVQGVLDSIARLPARARDAAEPLKQKMELLGQDLRSAKDGMNKWMDEFNMDSAVNNMQARIQYLTEEKLKVSRVKKSILESLQKADSLLKAKF
jgi:hypothetical protein